MTVRVIRVWLTMLVFVFLIVGFAGAAVRAGSAGTSDQLGRPVEAGHRYGG